jgi:pilus assembly protein CpaF
MTDSVQAVFDRTQEKVRQMSEFGYEGAELFQTQAATKFKAVLEDSLKQEPADLRQRVLDEYFEFGPLEGLFQDEEVSEILVNGPEAIWFEKSGRLHLHGDRFLSEATFANFFHRVCEQAKCQSTVEFPTATGHFREFRLTVIRRELTQSQHHISFRRHPKNPWTLEKLRERDWATDQDLGLLRSLIQEKKNFLIVGGTGSGKTSLINALLQSLPESERAVIIEDTPEIQLPNTSSMKMITREDPQGILKTIDQSQLLRHCLRLRPDRIVMGEIRGAEAKDLLMTLATGHGGSFGTLHASDPRQALIRLEMLIQMGAPQWSLQAVRRLIHLSLEFILVVGKAEDGKRKFQGIYKICSLEESGFLIEKVQEEL